MNESREQHLDELVARATAALRQLPIPDGPPPETVAVALRSIEGSRAVPLTIAERIQKMSRPTSKLAATTCIVLIIGVGIMWLILGGGAESMAFARVADALDRLRSATFDLMSEVKAQKDQTSVKGVGKGFFLAPSYQRTEMSMGADKSSPNMIQIFDHQAAKGLLLMPKAKVAVAMDMAKWRDEMKKSANGAPPDLFETVRRLVREGSADNGRKPEQLGRKEIDGRAAIGFRTYSNIGEMTLWADPETAWPVRIELTGEMFGNVHMVMNHFRYDVDLDSSLFSLQPPSGYSTQAIDVTSPTEDDLIKMLRSIAERSDGLFPTKLGMNKEVIEPLMAEIKPQMEKLEAKYGVKPKPGESPPPAMMAEAMKTLMPAMQRKMQGITYYMTLRPENDSHYAGGGVRLGTPDRAIFWYKPTGSEKYRVIYADLSIRELTAAEAKKLAETKPE